MRNIMGKRIALFLVPLIGLLFVFRDVLFSGRFFFSNDVLLANLPFLFYRGHEGAVIAQEMLSGFPLFATVNASWFYPLTTFLFSHLEATTAYLWLSMANLVLVYPFTYLYARKINLSPHASVLAAMTFTFSGQIMLWAPSIIATAFYFLLPASLYLFELSIEKKWFPKVALLALLGVLLGTGWLSSQVQYVFYIHTLYAVYVCVRLFSLERTRFPSQFFPSLIIPFTTSFLIGLPMIASILSFQSETLRAGGVALDQFVGSGYLPTDLIHFFLPFWHVNFVPLAEANLYMGIVPLIFLGIGVASYKKLQNRYALFFLGVFVFCAAVSIRYSPVAIALHYLPFWSAFREASRIMFIGGFAGSLLAGMGFDFLLAKREELDLYRHRLSRFFTRAFLFVALPVFIVFTLIRAFFFDAIKARLDAYVLTRVYPHTTGLPKEHYLSVAGNYLHQAIDQLSFFDAQVVWFVLFGSAAILLFRAYPKISAQRFAAYAIVITGLNFALVYGWHYPTVDARAIHQVPRTVLAMQEVENDVLSPYRFVSIFPAMTVFNDSVACPLSPEETVELQNELLQPNASIFYGIDDVSGYENFMPMRVSEALSYIGSESTAVPNPLFLERIPLQEKLQKILSRTNVLKAMNVKYVVSGVPLTSATLTPVDSWQVGRCKHPVYLYALAGTWPRYFTTNTISEATTSPSYEAAFDELNRHATPVVIIADTVPVKKFAKTFVIEAIPEFRAREIRFPKVVCTSSPCAFLIGNAYLSGWSATIDGIPASLLRANYVFMALMLAPGEHEVLLTYR